MAKILVVDDSRLTRRLVCRALENAGHEVVQVANGEEGLKAFNAFTPDCVISDLLMPVMNGFDFAAALREIDPDVPVLVSTADIQDKSRARVEALGVVRMLHKPLKEAEIVEAVREALASQEVAAR